MSEYRSFIEIAAEAYGDQEVEVYLNQKMGTSYYSEYDVENQTFTAGRIIKAEHEALFLRVKAFIKEAWVERDIVFNAWHIAAIMPKLTPPDPVHITTLMQSGMKR